MFPTFSFQESIEHSKGLAGVRKIIWWAGIMVALFCANSLGAESVNASGLERSESSFVVTNVAQFRSVPPELFLSRCSFHLNGIVTLVDTNRDLLVLQDETGAVALNPKGGVRNLGVEAGQRISVEAARCSPYVVGFPNYPYLPSSSEVRTLFEAPAHLGNYYLTRMRSYLHPPATGEYTFWIASDNSSELWLSATDEPTKVKRIAFISRYGWVAPREWTHYPSQRSESIFLETGKTYYIEAFQEQTSGDDHLAVAWQGPSIRQSVITNQYLTPWVEGGSQVLSVATNGIRREYWTNFSLGSLAPLAGPRPFASILSADELRVTTRSAEAQPRPLAIAIDEQLRPEDNYHWVEAQGDVTFCGQDDGGGFLELSEGDAQIQVRVLRSDLDSMRRFQNATVRVAGVCEGVYDQKGVLVPGLIWAAQENSVSLVDRAKTAPASLPGGQSSKLILTNGNPAMMGFYNTRGVVTFNDRVFGKDVMFVQEDTAAIFVTLKDRNFGNPFEVGHWVELGGAFQPGKNIPILSPLTLMELGWRSMPTPMTQVVQFPVPGTRDGRWTEVEGVVHAVNPNGTLMLVGSGGPLSVWIGKTSSEALSRYVDARLRVRGVLSLTIQEAPLLLVPSTAFADVEQEAPKNPFSMPARPVSGLVASDAEALPHRVKLTGSVTLGGRRSFFMQDESGGIRVQPLDHRDVQVGESVEVVGFPSVNGSVRTLTEALVRPAGDLRMVPPQKLNAGEGISFKNAGTLVQISANLVTQRMKAGSQVLELQEKQRVFEAELPLGQADLPVFAPGCRLQLSGVCDFEAVVPPSAGNAAAESPSTGALKIWLRTPADVVLLNGPPWFTWKYMVVLVGTLLTVLVVSLLRIHLLRRRLERHLAFSRQILESQENERHRIAANLHDSLGQNLLVIKNQARLAMQPTTDDSVLRHRLDEISDCASQAIEEVREITHALRPYQLDRLGLAQTIRATVSRAAENSPILFASHVDDVDGVFDKEAEIHVYRLVQEGVNNIVKHSAATEAAVVVKKLASAISLSIRDNGKGFDAGAMEHFVSPEDVGHGLNGIKERVRILGGTLVIDSRSGQGTSLSIEIPLSNHETK